MSRSRARSPHERASDADAPLNREILLGFWKVHILHHASEGPIYGQWIIKELRRHGYDVSPGTVYPLLARMERNGWLAASMRKRSHPRARREYKLTGEGRRILAVLRRQVREMHEEVV